MKVDKKEYQKPVLERLVLIPSENVLAVCASGTGSGSFGNPTCNQGSPNGCFQTGVQGPIVP
jgi:hypothetical protein